MSHSSANPEGVPALPLGDVLALGSHLRADDTPETLLYELAETVRRVVGAPYVYVRLRHVDTDALEAAAFAGVAPALQQRLRAEPVAPGAYQALLRSEHRLSNSFLLSADEFYAATAPSADADIAGGFATLLVPLRGRGERLIGIVFVALVASAPPLSPATTQVIEAIARQAATSVENVRLAERSARLLAKEQLLAALGRDIGATLDLDAIVARAVERIATAFGSGALALVDQSGAFTVTAAGGATMLLGHSFAPAEGIIGWVVEHDRAFFANSFDARSPHSPLDHNAQSAIVAPVRSGGHVIGTLIVGAPIPHAFTYEDVDLLEAIAAQIAGPITSARLYAEAQSLAAQVQRRADQLAVLNTIARLASASLDQEQSLPRVVEQVRTGFGYHQVDLFLHDEETGELVLAASAGPGSTVALGYRQLTTKGLLGRAARSSRFVHTDNAPGEPDFVPVAGRPDTRAELVVPITASSRLLGLINVEATVANAFSLEDQHLLETVADVLAGALENARLYRKAQAVAVLEERNRLARELHDSVTQQLFSMTLTSQAARTQLERNPQRVAAQLERLQETSTAALAEMRALILQLRPPALRDQSLVAALQQHAQLLAQREGISITLSVSGDERLARGVEQPLYRIVQEALNNVFKHANAKNVEVSLEFATHQLRVRVVDDGQGFEPTATAPGANRQIGMLSMRERAAEIGGTMDVYSTPGTGTEVVVTVPRVTNTS